MVVNATGDIFWYRRLRTKTLCEPSESMEKSCSFRFGSLQLTTNQQDFGNEVNFYISEELLEESPWKPKYIGIERHIGHMQYRPLEGSYAEVHCLLNVTVLPTERSRGSSQHMHISFLVVLLAVYAVATLIV